VTLLWKALSYEFSNLLTTYRRIFSFHVEVVVLHFFHHFCMLVCCLLEKKVIYDYWSENELSTLNLNFCNRRKVNERKKGKRKITNTTFLTKHIFETKQRNNTKNNWRSVLIENFSLFNECLPNIFKKKIQFSLKAKDLYNSFGIGSFVLIKKHLLLILEFLFLIAVFLT
jgi:hypothetical protein